ncbi:unnamed protein product [Durusdinium trenchii]|uniref:Uncharacterized protein n=1 Tax=Durusdinium trenchii TaxID=1381693 RepID=A0ABP0KKD3_9DINO
MGSPYLVISHRDFCPSCQREVDDEEMMVNEEGLQLHGLCGTVLERQGLHCESLQGDQAGGLQGADLSVLEDQGEWLAEQLRILKSLPGGARETGAVEKKQRTDARVGRPRTDASAQRPVLRRPGEEGKWRRAESGEEQFS